MDQIATVSAPSLPRAAMTGLEMLGCAASIPGFAIQSMLLDSESCPQGNHCI